MLMVSLLHVHVECDFLVCPEHSSCVESGDALCQCLPGYEEKMFKGQLSCAGKLYFIIDWVLLYTRSYQTLFSLSKKLKSSLHA